MSYNLKVVKDLELVIPLFQNMSPFDVIKTIENDIVVEYPDKPSHPILQKNHSVEDVLLYAEKLTQYNLDIINYPSKCNIYDLDQNRINTLVAAYIKDESGLYNIVPKQYADKLYDYAYSKSHDGGYYEVFITLYDLISIFED